MTGRIAPEALAVIDRIAGRKDAPRLAYGTDYQVSHQKSVVTGEVFDYTSACQTRSLPDWPAWFAPDRECWDGHSFT